MLQPWIVGDAHYWTRCIGFRGMVPALRPIGIPTQGRPHACRRGKPIEMLTCGGTYLTMSIPNITRIAIRSKMASYGSLAYEVGEVVCAIMASTTLALSIPRIRRIPRCPLHRYIIANLCVMWLVLWVLKRAAPTRRSPIAEPA